MARLMTTGEVVERSGVSATAAREWAARNAVDRFGPAFAWGPEALEAFAADLGIDAEELLDDEVDDVRDDDDVDDEADLDE